MKQNKFKIEVVKKIKSKPNFDQKKLKIACGLLYRISETKWKPLKKLAFTLPLMHA